MKRLDQLRQKLESLKLDGFVVPRADEYQGEYVPANAERLAWLTGFTGSAGYAVVLADKAAVFADGRYTIQAKAEVDQNEFALLHLIEEPPTQYLSKNIKTGQRIGYDPWVFTPVMVDRFKEVCAKKGAEFVPVASSPLDAIWKPRPKAAQAQIAVQDIKYAGKTHGEKRQMIASQLKEMGQDVLVLTQPDSIAWLLNIRGGDVPYNPFALSFALLRADASVDLYIDPWKLTAEVRQYFGNQIATHAPADFLPALAQLGGKKVSVDAGMTAQKIVDALRDVNAQITFAEDPCQLPKACKNETEIKGMRTAHRRDGVALTRFLYWMAQQKPAKLSEMIAAEMLEEIRGEYELFRGLSFPTIAGFGSNGAIVHYHANEKTNKKFKPNHLFLLDSGAQYQDGTTDVTRTIAIGKPTSEQRDRFTRVLKGHIALASAKFPRGTTGSQLDMLARQPLWEVGLDYDHGTGHGVGCYLSVHEGPQRISKIGNRVALQPGMVISNEPGYYKTGAYGIRIENLILVRPSKIKEYLEFETLTLAPIDRKLIDAKLLTKAEKTWINAYHARVYKELAKGMDRKEKAWLKAQTKKIS